MTRTKRFAPALLLALPFVVALAPELRKADWRKTALIFVMGVQSYASICQ